ncbi:NUDIX domain-containing protein [Evansella clarkii]|uniref:NUDIX domain-containing protein n=1 Tax=Evansella clarkii TaxID=79879 RepID=UPI00099668DF|nr:NUDIX hydrolase [Evansella clarkii]
MIRKAVGAIVIKNNKFLIVHKTMINTKKGKQSIKGEWDFIKGGVEEGDKDLKSSILRELQEETGSNEYRIIKQFEEKICFSFPAAIKTETSYEKQETTMYLVEFLGNTEMLTPIDNEISDIKFIEKEKVLEILSHQDTKDFFLKNI